MSFLRHDGIYRSDVAAETATTWGRVPPPVGRPRAPVQRTRREELRALLIVRDEFRPAIPRFGLLSSRARLRFPGNLRMHPTPVWRQRKISGW